MHMTVWTITAFTALWFVKIREWFLAALTLITYSWLFNDNFTFCGSTNVLSDPMPIKEYNKYKI